MKGTIKFIVGRTYAVPALHGGYLNVEIVTVDREANTVEVKHESGRLETLPLETLNTVNGLSEAAIAWEYHDSKCYFYACD